jgi:membrane-bound serine protease (ClpP class)
MVGMMHPVPGVHAQAPDTGQASPVLSGNGRISPDQEGSQGAVWLIPIRGDIEPSMTAFVRREARKASVAGAEFIVFEIDTFGGRVDSALQITSFIISLKNRSHQNVRTIAWVHNSDQSMGVSWSAGALIAFSCDAIYMAGGTSMGAAAPVTLGADGSTEATGEKTVAAVRSQMAALAEQNGHPRGIALAMVDYDVELWEVWVDGKTRILTLPELEGLEKSAAAQAADGAPGTAPGPRVERRELISPSGKLLSLTAGEAYRYGLAAGIANDRNALLGAIGATGEFIENTPSAADEIISLLTAAPVQALLIILGLVMLFLEINTPGFGIPGTVAVICFLTVFGSGALLGRVGSLELILFLVGMGLLAVEIFVLPGFGVMGIAGIILIGLSLVFSMQDFVIPRFDWEWNLMGRNVVVVCIGIIAAVTGIAIIALLGPKTRLFDRLTLKTQITGTAGGPDPEDAVPGGLFQSEERDYAKLKGKTGTAVSILRPSGKATIEGKLYAVEAEGIFIESGTAVKVIRILGNRITVGKE